MSTTFFTAAKLFARFALESAGDQGIGTWQDGIVQYRLTWNGLDISIESPKGSIREGVDKNGKPWRTTMQCDYGYFEGYEGFDGDKLDVLLGPELTCPQVFVIHQKKQGEHAFDECKVVIGCESLPQAHALYLSNYQEGWEVNIHSIESFDVVGFKAWLDMGNGQDQPSTFFTKDRSFAADFSTADFSASPYVTVPARLSRVGSYADKGIELTESDFDRVALSVSDANPVPMNLAHLRRGSVLDDAGLGEIRRTWRKGRELWGEIAVPQWLASLARDRGLKLPVSAEWDIKTKTLRGCAWERTPRIEDAQALL